MFKGLQLATLVLIFSALLAQPAAAQNCSPDGALTAPAGGFVTTASTLRIYNSTEEGPNSAAARTAVDAQDDAWRAAAVSQNIGNSFITYSDTTTPENLSAPLPQSFNVGGVNVSYDFRDFPTNYRSISYPCTGDQIVDESLRRTFLSKRADMQTSPTSGISNEAPRPASLHNPNNQPLIYDEIEQPGRNTTINATVFTFSFPVKGFGAWFGDVETRTDGSGQPLTVRFLDASGNRIGEDVLIEPRAVQTGCGGSNAGCGNRVTRWIGFTDSNPTARVKQMVLIIGAQGTTTDVNSQRFAFIGPTIPVTFTAAPVGISGRVLSAAGIGIRNARITLQNMDGTGTRTTLSNAFGYYRFVDLPVGDTYMITVSAKGREFPSGTQVFTLLDELTEFNFVEGGAPRFAESLLSAPAAKSKGGKTNFRRVKETIDPTGIFPSEF